MTSRVSDQVHRLIRSMSPAEKRYFKLYAGRHRIQGGGNHLLLFDAIGGMEAYDEEALLRRFKGRGLTARFAVAKQRLHDSLLQSLSAFHAASSVDARLRRRLHEVELLYGRALYDDAERHLLGVRRLALRHEKLHVLIEVQHWQRRLMERTHYHSVTAAALEEQDREAAHLLEQLAELDQFWDRKSRVALALYGQGQARSAGQVEQVRAIAGCEGGTKPYGTAQARYLHHHLLAATAIATGDLETGLQHLLTNRDLLEEQRAAFVDEPHRILAVLSNLAHVCMRTGRYAEAIGHLEAYRRAPAEWCMPHTGDLALKLFATGTTMELSILCASGAFEKALTLVPAMEQGLQHHGNALGTLRRAGCQFQVAIALFGGGRAAEALRWCHRLLNDAHDSPGGFAAHARLLELMLLLETGDQDLLPYALRNTERYLKGHLRAHRCEQLLLRLVRDLLKARDRAQEIAAYQRAHDGLVPLANDPLEQPAFEHLDPLTWVRSRITGRPYGQLVRERAGGRHAA
ncbi:MAG: hypothetical protein IT228_15720 [Flavobacteriales bacterium]|nr:hypothetical protein [Flavobacteriales bacterium]